jgi:hypothetical protein
MAHHRVPYSHLAASWLAWSYTEYGGGVKLPGLGELATPSSSHPLNY